MAISMLTAWEHCQEDAIRRDRFWARRQLYLTELPDGERLRLDRLSDQPRDDSNMEMPGSERADREEALFMASLSPEERAFLSEHKGLGNSQKAEVAWLEKRYLETGNACYLFDEVDVRDFLGR
jgi:hypothetical protein